MARYHTGGPLSTLSEALYDYYTVDDLKELLQLAGVTAPKRKDDMVARLDRALAGEHLRGLWGRLEPLQQAAVAEAVHGPTGAFNVAGFLAKYGELPDWGTPSGSFGRLKRSLLDVFFLGDRTMPEDLRARLCAFVPRPAATTLRTTDALPDVWKADAPVRRGGVRPSATKAVPLAVHETERTAAREVLAVLRLIDAGKLAVSEATGRPTAATVAAVGRMLEGSDFYPAEPTHAGEPPVGAIRAFAWPLLLQAGGLAQASGTKLQLTPAGRQALIAPPAETLKGLWARWQATTLLDELSRIECVKGQGGKGQRSLTPLAGRRTAIREALAACPPGAWAAVDEFERYLRAAGGCLRLTDDPWSLYVGDPKYGTMGYDGNVAILETRYLLAYVLEYAATLGLVDVALVRPAGARDDYEDVWDAYAMPWFSRYDGLVYLRLTALGAYCLGLSPAYQPASPSAGGRLRVTPGSRVEVAAGELAPSEILALDAYAERQTGPAWELKVPRLLAAIDAGHPLDELRAFLEAHSDAPLPARVEALFTDVEARTGQVRDRGPVRLLECADEALAALLAQDPRTRKHCRPAGGACLVVSADAEHAFRKALREVGYLVARAGEVTPGASAPARTGPPSPPRTTPRGARRPGSRPRA